jgi:hypothetical protein
MKIVAVCCHKKQYLYYRATNEVRITSAPPVVTHNVRVSRIPPIRAHCESSVSRIYFDILCSLSKQFGIPHNYNK